MPLGLHLVLYMLSETILTTILMFSNQQEEVAQIAQLKLRQWLIILTKL